MIDLDQLGSIQLPVPSEAFLRDLSSRVAPVLNRRRRMRLLRNLSVATFAIVASSVVLLLFRGPIIWPFGRSVGPVVGSYQSTPIDTALESSDLVIQGLVTKVNLSREYVSISFRVLESHPTIADKSITVSAPGLGTLDAGRQYLVLLNQVNGVYTHPNASFGYGEYPIEETVTGPIVRNLVPGENEMPLAQAWTFIREAFDRTHGAPPPSAESLAPFREALRQGTIPEARRALEVLKRYPENGPDEVELLWAIVNRYPSMRPHENTQKSKFALFVREALEVLIPIASEQTAQRLVELYLEDMSDLQDCSLDDPSIEAPLLRLAMKHPGAARGARVYQLLGREVIYRDGNGNREGRAVLMRPRYEILQVLAETPGEDIEEIVAAIYADPVRFHADEYDLKHLSDTRAGVQQPRVKLKSAPLADPGGRLKEELRAAVAEGRGWSTSLLLRIPPGDATLVPIVKGADLLNFSSFIQYKLPDPEFIPLLRKSLEDERVLKSTLHTALYRILSALHACGDGEFALAYARQTLAEAKGARGDWDAFAKGNAMLFLGEFGGESDLSQIARFGDPATLNTFWRNLRKSGLATAINARFNPPPPADDAGGWLELCSLLARTRLGDPSVVPELKARLESDRSGWRVAAATALYYLEDEAGTPVVKLLRAYAEDSDPSLMSGVGAYHWVVAYFPSPRMDSLRLERLRNGFGPGEGDMVHDVGFLLRHGNEVIRLLVKHLESRDWRARTFARHSLESITAIQVDWEEGAPSTGNREAIAQLTAAADALIRELQAIPTNPARGTDVSVQ